MVKVKNVITALFIIALAAGCGSTPGEREAAEQKALMAECQAAGSTALAYYNGTDEGGVKRSTFAGYKIPKIISEESSGPFAVKQSHGTMRIIERTDDMLKIEGRPLGSRGYGWKVVSTVTAHAVTTDLVE